MRPVFIHSLWRAGSTYVWNRFRTLAGVYAYYEPFQEALGIGTRDELLKLSSDSWASRHPHIDTPYFTEYLPLIEERGIPGFQKSFSIDHYFETRPSILAGEHAYVSTLIEYTAGLGRAPVLGCCRTMGRAWWMKAQFGGAHIVVLRDPRQQWYSGHLRKLEAGHSYFEVMPFQILGKSEWEPAMRIARIFGIPTLTETSFFLEHERYFSLFGTAPRERSYAVFYALYMLSLQRAMPAVDVIVDIEHLSTDAAYRTAIEQRIHSETGLPVSFSDSAVSHHSIPSDMMDFAMIEQGVDAMLWRDTATAAHASA